MKKGFTIIELIVVMGVMAVLAGLAATGVSSFRNTLEMQSAYADLESTFRTFKNQALNSISFDGGTTVSEYYIIRIAGSDFSTYQCTKVNATTVSCSTLATTIKQQNLSRVNLAATGCTHIAFKRRTGEIYTVNLASLNTTITQFTKNSCTINVTHAANSLLRKQIIINPLLNDIQFET